MRRVVRPTIAAVYPRDDARRSAGQNARSDAPPERLLEVRPRRTRRTVGVTIHSARATFVELAKAAAHPARPQGHRTESGASGFPESRP
jgi:hypothetical protein